MIFVPKHLKDDTMSVDHAAGIIRRHGEDDLLAGMEMLQTQYQFAASEGIGEEDDWIEAWIIEINAYNTVFESMAQLFA